VKVYNNKTELIEDNLDRTGVFVDVFPIDGMPDTIEETLAFRDLTTSFVESLKKTSQYYKIKRGDY
jgi:phosphorylcholine metabolism protein LicD